MVQQLERARAYLDTLEADRQAALTLSEQKADEAKLIKAAIEMLGGEITAGDVGTDLHREEPAQRRVRRPIREMILRELSFSGDELTTAQIAEMKVDGPSARRPSRNRKWPRRQKRSQFPGSRTVAIRKQLSPEASR